MMKMFWLAVALFLTVPTAHALLDIAPWYPQETNYIFECSADGFDADRYDWDFGDGEKLIDITESSVYHTYTVPGTYEVSCTASANGLVDVELLRIIVPNVSADTAPVNGTSVAITIAPWYPQEAAYVFFCEAEGFEPDHYDWSFGDGSKLYDLTENNVYHVFESGEYDVSCVASAGEAVAEDQMHLIIRGIPEEPTPIHEADLSIAAWFPQGTNYVFVCETSAFDAEEYLFEFGDGEKLSLARNDVWHTYTAPGEYDVACTAKNGEMLAKDSMTIVVE